MPKKVKKKTKRPKTHFRRKLPCGDIIEAERGPGSGCWTIRRAIRPLARDLTVFVANVLAVNMPDLTEFLEDLYDNTPKSYRK